MTIKKALIVSATILLVSACSARNPVPPPTQILNPNPTATSMPTSVAVTVENGASDSVIATSVAATLAAGNDIVATSVAATIEANNSTATAIAIEKEATQEALPTNTATPTLSPTPTSTSLPVGSATASLPPTATTTGTVPSAPTVSVSVGTNCRTGPGKIYGLIGELKVGESAEVIGKKPSYNYWIIKNPDTNGECWLWGEYATVTGDTSKLKEYPVPALPPSAASPTPASASGITASVSVETNCRKGPGRVYDQVSVLKVGQIAEVVGKKEFYNYWIINNPAGEGACWLWGEYATVTGDTSKLKEYPVPALPAVTTPAAPSVSVSVGTNCRTGPGKIYEIIGGLSVGESAEVIGKKTSLNYWVINNPDAAGNCWLWGYYATVAGDTSGLPEYTVGTAP